MNPACYDAPVLADYLAGRAAAPLARQVESHLRTCRRCQQALVRSSPRADSLLQAVRATQSVDPAESEPELALALGAIGGLHSAATISGSFQQSSSDTGRLISNYELQKKLGEGGMGAVYLARHLRLKRSVAIKLLKGERSQDESAVARFQVEIEAVGKLEHPHIVRALDAGEDRGTHFLVMEYLAGIDVARLVRGLGPFGLPEACELVRQAALGLYHAHENDVIHRDVKPSNLMLLADGKVKVLDLGLAHFRPDWAESQGLTRADQVLGTLLYVAPEQLAPGGKVDARTDVYSLGVTLAEILLGRVPCRSGQAVLIGDEERATRPDVPPDIWQLIARMTALDPHGRPDSMLTVAQILRPWCAAANLGRLLEKLAGRTAFADPMIATAGIAAQAYDLPSRNLAYESEFGDVLPPPIAGVMEMRESAILPPRIPPLAFGQEEQSESDLQRARQGTDYLAGRLVWLASGCVLALFAALVIGGLSQNPWNPDPPPKAASSTVDVSPPATGTLEIYSPDPVDSELVQSILDQSELLAVPVQGGSPTALHKGENTLAAGQYKFLRAPEDWPNWELDQGIDQELQTFMVKAGATNRIRMPNIRLPTPWNLSQIPEAGHSARYTGSITWRSTSDPSVAATPDRDVNGGAAVSMGSLPKPVELVLSTLADETVSGTLHRWLQLELAEEGGYRETAYLLIDTNEYEQHHRLVIERGWIEATSEPIRAALARALPDSPPTSIVAEFETSVDRLFDAARRIHLTLPSNRIGIHAALILLFDVDCQAAPSFVRTFRASQLEPISYTLATVRPSNVWRKGMVIEAEQLHPSPASNQQPMKTVLHVKRCESVPFSFVSFKLSGPQLAGDLTLSSFTDLAKPSSFDPVPLDRLTGSSQRILELKLKRDPLDVATLPADGAGVRYRGGLTFPPLHYDALVRMLRTEVIDGRRFRWLEVDVTTKLAGGVSHHERAVILFDETRFEQRGELEIVRGWFETGKHWLPLTTDAPRPMETIAADLQLLEAPLPSPRLGVNDVLALLSKTSLQSMFGDVRDKFSHWRTLHGLEPHPTPNDKLHLPTADRTVAADVWTLNIPNDVTGYEIARSKELPFDIAKVRITISRETTLTAEVGDVIAADAAELDALALPDAAKWEAQKAAHEAKIEAVRRKQNTAPLKAAAKQRRLTIPGRP